MPTARASPNILRLLLYTEKDAELAVGRIRSVGFGETADVAPSFEVVLHPPDISSGRQRSVSPCPVPRERCCLVETWEGPIVRCPC